MASSNEAMAVMLKRSDGTQELVPISTASGSSAVSSESKEKREGEDTETQYVTMNEDSVQQHYTISSEDIGTTHMVLSKELQDLVDVEYTGEQENTTVYVEVPQQYQGEEVVMVGDQQEVISARGNAQVEVRHHVDYNDGAWSGLATLMEAAQAQEASTSYGGKDIQNTDIQIEIRSGAPDEITPEDVEVEIVQHPDIGNEVEISNTDHNKAAQLTARIQNVLAQQSGIPLIPQLDVYATAPAEMGEEDSDDSDYENSEEDSTSSADEEYDQDDSDRSKRGRKRRNSRRVYFPRVKARKGNALEERRYKKRKFDPGPTMILQEEISSLLMDRGQNQIKQEVEQAIKDAEMDESAMPVLQIEESDQGQVSKKTIYKCPKCPKYFEQRIAFKNHYISHSKVPGGHMSIRKYKCAICDFEKIHERWVNSHKKYHAGLCPFMCTECGCAFNAPYRLVSHHRKFHPGLFVFTCEKCMMKFRSQHEVNAHKMTYHQPAKKRYVCVQCGARFMEQKNLIEHRINHHKDYECLLCPDKTFKSVDELEEHTAEKHTAEKLKEAIEADKLRRKLKSEKRETDEAVESIQLESQQAVPMETEQTVVMDTTSASVVEEEVTAIDETNTPVADKSVTSVQLVETTREVASEPIFTPRRTPKELVVISGRKSSSRKQYSPEALLKGMELFHSGYSIRGAAKVVGVPEATLRKKLKDYTPSAQDIPHRVHQDGSSTIVRGSVPHVIHRRNVLVAKNTGGQTPHRIVVTAKHVRPQVQEQVAQYVEMVSVPTQPKLEQIEDRIEIVDGTVQEDGVIEDPVAGQENPSEENSIEEIPKVKGQSEALSPVKKTTEPRRLSPRKKSTEPVEPPIPPSPPTKKVREQAPVSPKKGESAVHKPSSETSPVKATTKELTVAMSPRRSSRSRKATEKGKSIFDIFESKDIKMEPQTDEDKATEEVAEEVHTSKVVKETNTRRAKGTRASSEVESQLQEEERTPAVQVKEKNKEITGTPSRSTRSSKAKAEVSEGVEENPKSNIKGRIKVVTKKIVIEEKSQERVEEKETNIQEGGQIKPDVELEVRVTRSGRMVESTPKEAKQIEPEEDKSVSEPILCINCGQINATEEEAEAHEKLCAATDIEIPSSPVHPTQAHSVIVPAQEVVEVTKTPDNILFGLPDGSFVMVGESSESDVNKILSKEITVYQCGLCCTEFSAKPELQQHISQAHVDEHFEANSAIDNSQTTCQRCGDLYSTPDELMQHYLEKHGEFWCDKCCRFSDSETLYRIHTMWHEKIDTGEKILKVTSKRKSAPSATVSSAPTSSNIILEGDQEMLEAWTLTAHLESQNQVVQQIRVVGRKCPECNVEFENVSTLKRHYFRQHEPDLSKWPYQCALCKKAFATVSEMKKHNSVHVDLKPFQCPYCKKYFKREDHMKRHIQYKHENVKMFVCEECGRPFIREDYLRSHMKTHRRRDEPDVEKILSAGLYKCPVCGMFCPTADKLKIHQATHTDPVLGCDQCDQRFNSQYNLKLHYKMYHQGVQYKCQYCIKAFATQNSRLAHEREVHRGRTKNYKCRHCGKMCTKSRIKRHEMAHRHQYKCPYPECERIFKMKKGCEEHYIREHTGEKQHVCEICDRNFLNNQHLMRHKESHKKLNRWRRRNQTYRPKLTEEKTEIEQLQVEETVLYQCPMEQCEMLFQTQQMMQQHFIQTHTSDVETPEGAEPGQNAHVSAAEVLAAMQQN